MTSGKRARGSIVEWRNGSNKRWFGTIEMDLWFVTIRARIMMSNFTECDKI